jgi:hypothetical protein
VTARRCPCEAAHRPAARDGDALALEVATAADVGFAAAATFDNAWPLAPAGSFAVDGMTAAQIAVAPVGAAPLESGTLRNLAFSARLPANGYEADTLKKVNVVNLGTAQAGLDIGRVELWTDANGDGQFDATVDTRIGNMQFTGDRWEITGKAVPMPAAGVRVFVTVDVLETAAEGNTVRLALPGAPDFALGVASNNDGPLDGPVAGTAPQTISTANRVTLTAVPMPAAVVHPGARGVPVLQLHAVNGYSVTHALASVVVTNLASGSGSVAQLDNETAKLDLRLDGNGDGRLDDFATDPLLGTTTFDNGQATFSGLDVPLAAGAAATFIVTADVSAAAAADGDVLGAELSDGAAVGFHEVTAVAAGWPLDSGARATIDGMVAAQIVNLGAPVATLGASGGPVAALDVVVPRDGYRDDVLQQVQVVNAGTAPASDIAEMRLWRDGGDGAFDAGTADDRDLVR